MTDKGQPDKPANTPQSDAAPQFHKSKEGRNADGLASAEPRKVPGKKSPNSTYSQDKKSHHT
ncbi:hypothetical protein [Limoniibacter endophyticus]|uniref:Uncharacterized protein n=1 Tax=Limoniibacter endophyticus TaxID=1565040 RepID=A0A8J3GHL9_9HYPH|nr:hypothetical protein [Limoniibacter endophyticus]GHC75632.1 hypothetical protein GCM10010136_25770 [Limoniibacter endophyticus]